VIEALRQSTPEATEKTVCENFTRLMEDDPWLANIHF